MIQTMSVSIRHVSDVSVWTVARPRMAAKDDFRHLLLALPTTVLSAYRLREEDHSTLGSQYVPYD